MSYKFISYDTFKPHTVNIPNLGETELSFEKLYPEMQNTCLVIYKAKNNVEDPWVSRKMHFKVADTIPPERRANLIRLVCMTKLFLHLTFPKRTFYPMQTVCLNVLTTHTSSISVHRFL